METIWTSAIGLVDSVVGLITANKAARYGRLPDWMSPADFYEKDKTADIILIGLFAVLIIIVIAIAIKK